MAHVQALKGAVSVGSTSAFCPVALSSELNRRASELLRKPLPPISPAGSRHLYATGIVAAIGNDKSQLELHTRLSHKAMPQSSPQPRKAVQAKVTIGPSGGISSTLSVPEVSDMFCFQCEQTKEGIGCSSDHGVCGKDAHTAALQDLLVEELKCLSRYAARLHRLDTPTDPDVDFFVQEAVFSTLTNTNFDPAAVQSFINKTVVIRQGLKATLDEASRSAGVPVDPNLDSAFLTGPQSDAAVLELRGRQVGILQRQSGVHPDVFSLQELLTYGIKGMAAYAAHAHQVGRADRVVARFLYDAFDYMSRPSGEQELGRLLELCMECGKTNLRTMEILHEGHVYNFGAPTPTRVRLTPVEGKCILVSGHDLMDLYTILKMTEGKGINVYTHGEILPAHGYPKLKAFKHLVGNYGGAWQAQKIEFGMFPGPILVTTNCILEPKDTYSDRVYSLNAVGHSKVPHIDDRRFKPLIDQALAMEGFPSDGPEQYTMTGFQHEAVLSVADQLVAAVKEGRIKRFFLIGGCDGYEADRHYFRDVALGLPTDAVVLTLACGKYRFNKRFDEFGTIAGTDLPRLMDIGQCSDAYSAIRIATALAEVFETDVNSLPLTMIISWFEQKAIAVLLTLLSLGVKNIRLGPRLPAFISPNVLQVLVDKFNLTPINVFNHPEEDIKAMMQ